MNSVFRQCFENWKSNFFTLQTTLSKTELQKASKIISYESGEDIVLENHSDLNSTQFFELLEGAKLFVGLGFPFEGPSPIEALQAGCYFINPIWDPPIGRSLNGTKNKDYIKGFFNDKPTLRALSSQVPYLASLDNAQTHHKIINTKLEASNELKQNLKKIKLSKG